MTTVRTVVALYFQTYVHSFVHSDLASVTFTTFVQERKYHVRQNQSMDKKYTFLMELF